MSGTKPKIDEIHAGNKAEEIFQHQCDENQYHTLYFNQDMNTKSEYHNKHNLKRPDFLVTIPNVGNIFVDVKARSLHSQYFGKKNVPVFQFEDNETNKFLELKHITGIPVWYGIYKLDNKKDPFTSKCYLIPMERVRKFKPKYNKSFRNQMRWVPEVCFNEFSTHFTFEDKCKDCLKHNCKDETDRRIMVYIRKDKNEFIIFDFTSERKMKIDSEGLPPYKKNDVFILQVNSEKGDKIRGEHRVFLTRKDESYTHCVLCGERSSEKPDAKPICSNCWYKQRKK